MASPIVESVRYLSVIVPVYNALERSPQIHQTTHVLLGPSSGAHLGDGFILLNRAHLRNHQFARLAFA